MALHGKNLIGCTLSSCGIPFRAMNPRTGQALEPEFHDATESEIDQAIRSADEAFEQYRGKSAKERAAFLDHIAKEVEDFGPVLIDRAMAETGLPQGRLEGERLRTTNQLRMFASLVREGSWVDARIDRAVPDRKPLPRPNIRRMLVPIGPCSVFGASNFPLAFSAAGGDSASALAAGCPVVLKAHPAHPGVSEMVSMAILKAADATGMPSGIFSMLHGASPQVGLAIVTHPLIKAVGFTGSLRAGRALFDAAATRPEPIPVHAEMGSLNPIFILPGAMQERMVSLAEGIVQSMLLGVGQFCTKPGLLLGVDGGGMEEFLAKIGERINNSMPETMLHAGILQAFDSGVERLNQIPGVERLAQSHVLPDPSKTQAAASFYRTTSTVCLAERQLSEEVFGPCALFIGCSTVDELAEVARSLDGHLTATIHGTETDLDEASELIAILERKAGRLIINGYPTGVEVCPSMHHGGPYPATTDSRATSVGTAAILRFSRPVCYQNFPEHLLPTELRNRNECGIWRLVDGEWTKAEV